MIHDPGAFVGSEYGKADFGDARLTRRLLRAAEALARDPAASFPEAMKDDAELEGWYRFLDNDEVTPEAVLSPHVDETFKRAERYAEVIVAHDTTEGRFGGGIPRRGCGPLAGGGHGFMAHVALAVAGVERRDPLGVLALHTWVRTERDETPQEKKRRGKKARADAESKRWIEAVLKTERQVAERGAKVRLIHVADRECDFYEFLATMVRSDFRFVVRVQHDRVLERRDGDTQRLSDVIESAPLFAERDVQLGRRAPSPSPKDRKKHPPRESRRARLAITAMPVEVPATDSVSKLDLPPSLRLHVVRVRELDPPAGEDPVEWQLFTTLPIDTPELVLRVVDTYRVRWMIEELFKALKTGCQFEKRQLETKEHLVNALAVLLPIAWQLLRLRHLARTDGDAPATDALTSQQLDVLRAFVPDIPVRPTVSDALLAVAKLGGHLKSNGSPGWLVLGRGYQTLLTYEAGWAAAIHRASGPSTGGGRM